MKLPERLPTLDGRWFAVYRVMWWIALAMALFAGTVGAWLNEADAVRLDRTFYSAGLRLTEIDREVTFAPIGDALRGRVPAGSRLVAIDERPMPVVSSFTNWHVLADAIDGSGRTVRLKLRTPKDRIVMVTVRRGPHHLAQFDHAAPISHAARSMLDLIAGLLTAATVIATSVLLFRRRARDPVVALFSLSLLGFVIGSTIDSTLGAAGANHVIVDYLRILPFALLALAVAVFPASRFTPRWTIAVVPMIGFVATLPWWPLTFRPFGNLALLGTLLFAVGAAGWRFYRLAPGVERQQIKWAVLGLVVWLALGIVNFAAASIDQHVSDSRQHYVLLLMGDITGPLAFVALCGGLLVSLLRYRLYDAEAAISRSATLAALGLCLVAVFTASEKVIETLGAQWFGGSMGSTAGVMAAVLAAVLLVPMHRTLDRWAEHRFQRHLIRLRKLPELVGDLRETAALARIGAVAVEHVTQALRATGAAIRLDDGATIATKGVIGDAPMSVPLEDEGCGHVGVLLLGRRPDGTLFAKDEREALASVTGPVARALAIVRMREAKEVRWDQQFASLRKELDARLAPLEGKLA